MVGTACTKVKRNSRDLGVGMGCAGVRTERHGKEMVLAGVGSWVERGEARDETKSQGLW